MTDAQAFVVAFLVAPAAIISIVAMIRGYHVTLRLFRPKKCEDDV